MSRILFLLIIFVLLAFPCLAQKSKTLTNADRTQIIKEILSDTDFLEIDDVGLNECKNIANLSRKNLPHNLKSFKVKGIEFQLFTPKQIEEESKSAFKYHVFEEFRVKSSKIQISFDSYLINTTAGVLFSTRTDYEYRKISGHWRMVKRMPRPNGKS